MMWTCVFLVMMMATANSYNMYLSINPMAYTLDKVVIRRRLEINWYNIDTEPQHRVVLKQGGFVVFEFSPIDFPSGYIVTNISLPYPSLEHMGYTSTCLFSYHAEYNDGFPFNLLGSACLSNQPQWMFKYRTELGDMSLGDMMMVVSHDAGAYREYLGVEDDNPVTGAVYAQEEDILHQLIWGARVLDVRVGVYPTDEQSKFWLSHGIIKTHPMAEGIDQVKTFLKNTQEIVVWDNYEFNQHWTDDLHTDWMNTLVSEFSDWLVTPGDLGWDISLNQIWSQSGLADGEGRLLLTYNDPAGQGNDVFFPQVFHKVGDGVDEVEKLRSFLELEIEEAGVNSTYRPWKPSCNLTPTIEDIIIGRWSGLREMAEAVNREVTQWWRDDWPNLKSTFPVVDFFLGSNMVNEAIRRNLVSASNVL